jgi:excisionase family DNA binding protein
MVKAGRGATPRDGDDSVDLSLQEAADLLGVHYMTAYRYVRTGRLDATRVGSTWRVPRASLAALRPQAAAGRTKRGVSSTHPQYARRLRDRLVRGDEVESWRVLEQALASAYGPEDLYLEVLGPALSRIGDDWAAGRVTVAEEHRASALVYRLTGRLGPSFVRRGRTRGVVVLGAPANDFHGLASALVGDVLRGRGFSVADLGANTPTESFVEAVTATDRLVATGIVVSVDIPDRDLTRTISTLKKSSAAPLLLGGLGIRDEDHARRLGADAWTGTARGAVDWIAARA